MYFAAKQADGNYCHYDLYRAENSERSFEPRLQELAEQKTANTKSREQRKDVEPHRLTAAFGIKISDDSS